MAIEFNRLTRKIESEQRPQLSLDLMLERNFENVDFDIVRDLIEHGADIDKIQHKPCFRIELCSEKEGLPSAFCLMELIRICLPSGAQLDYIEEEPALRIPLEKLSKKGLAYFRRLDILCELIPKTFLLKAWEQGNEEVAKKLIQLGAKIEFSEKLYKEKQSSIQPPLSATMFGANSPEHELTEKQKFNMEEQIELSKQFFEEEKAKWSGIAVAYICVKAKTGRYLLALLEGFLINKKSEMKSIFEQGNSQISNSESESKMDVDVESNLMSMLNKEDKVRKAFHFGYAMLKNRLTKMQQTSVRFFPKAPIPQTLLFLSQVEHREKALTNEIC